MNTGSEEIKIHHENVNGEISLSPTYIMNVAQLIIILNANQKSDNSGKYRHLR